MFARDVARYDDRHRVKSGITGWAQVHGLRGQTSIADRIEWDNYYIANWSLKLDLKIVLLTVAELLRFRDSQAELRPPQGRSAAQAPRRALTGSVEAKQGLDPRDQRLRGMSLDRALACPL